MIEGDLTAVVSFIGVIVQLGGELLLVLLFTLLRRYVLRRGYFAAWTAAWACGVVAILALCVRYILMPRLDGYQTCAIIKRNPRFAAVPVIMLSSKDGLFDKARGRMVGSEDYLTKPFTKDQLLQAVEQHRRTS